MRLVALVNLVVAFLRLQVAHGASSKFPSWSFVRPSSRMEWTPVTNIHWEVHDNDDNTTTALHDTDNNLIVMLVPNNVTNGTELYEWYVQQHDGSNHTAKTSAFARFLTRHEDVVDLDTLLSEKSKVMRLQANHSTIRLCVISVSTSLDSNATLVDANDVRRQGRELGAAITSLVKGDARSVLSLSVVVPPSFRGYQECLTTLLSSLYVDKRYKGSPVNSKDDAPSDQPSLEKLHCWQSFSRPCSSSTSSSSPWTLSHARQQLAQALHLARGIYLAKDIVQAPHNILNSAALAETAQRLEQESRGKLKCDILELKDCEQRGMGAYLGVARGSETFPKFIHMTYRARKRRGQKKLRKVGIVGKGLLFDTGGYNIKTAMMELMKFDCGGAAAVLGAARAVAALQPEGVEAHFVVAACENMINERAIVPGDILSASNGKTIEVLNTDAEGRLTMADALVYVDQELGCEQILELSTLTGACVVSLGSAMAGLWVHDDDLASDLLDSSLSTGEKLWRMPLEASYKDQLKSKIADLRNIGTARFGGAITAALFLNHFVEDGKPYAHVDMAGPVWNMKLGCASGWGTKLVTDWICRQGSDSSTPDATK